MLGSFGLSVLSGWVPAGPISASGSVAIGAAYCWKCENTFGAPL